MTDQELIQALRGAAVETGSLLCLGCGYEHSCTVHGCAILHAAAERLEELTDPPSNGPLTLDELREMDGEPVWIVNKYGQVYADVLDNVAKSEGRIYIKLIIHQRLQESGYGKTWLAYRRKPEEE